ncbi:MAG: hypothetical protein R3E31_14285 [Chloroflexota bacterium]
MAALDGAFSFKQVQHVAMRIGENLNLDMMNFCEIFFDDNVIVAKCGLRFAPCGLYRIGKFCLCPNDAHAFAAAASTGLDQYRVANGRAAVRSSASVLPAPSTLAITGTLALCARCAGGCFAAHHFHRFWVGANEGDALFGTGAGRRQRFRWRKP